MKNNSRFELILGECKEDPAPETSDFPDPAEN